MGSLHEELVEIARDELDYSSDMSQALDSIAEAIASCVCAALEKCGLSK